MLKTRVSRCLFGPVDHDIVQKDLKAKLLEITREGCTRWNFDFTADTPMRGYFDWLPDNEIPTFYNKVSVPRKVGMQPRCRAHSKKRDVSESHRTGLHVIVPPSYDVTDYGTRDSKLVKDNKKTLRHSDDIRVPGIQSDISKLTFPAYKNRSSDEPMNVTDYPRLDSDDVITHIHSQSPFRPVESHNKQSPVAQSHHDLLTLKDTRISVDRSICSSNISSTDYLSPKPSFCTDISIKSSAISRTPSAFVSVNLCKNGVKKRGVKSPRLTAKKIRLTPITSLFRTTKLSQSRGKLSSNNNCSTR